MKLMRFHYTSFEQNIKVILLVASIVFAEYQTQKRDISAQIPWDIEYNKVIKTQLRY
jgi:hypothetical protein